MADDERAKKVLGFRVDVILNWLIDARTAHCGQISASPALTRPRQAVVIHFRGDRGCKIGISCIYDCDSRGYESLVGDTC